MKYLMVIFNMFLLFLFGCSGGGNPTKSTMNDGILQEKSAASFRIAVNDPEVDRVSVDVSADDMDTIRTNLTIVNDTAVGIIGDILVGVNRKFAVSAFKGLVLSHYGDTVATIVEADTTEVPINLQALYGSANFAIPVSSSFPGTIDSIYVRAIVRTDTLSLTLESGEIYTGELTGIPVDEAVEFSIFVVSDGEIKYEGHTTANVREGQPVDVTLDINPIVGSAEIVASINAGWEGSVTGSINKSGNGYVKLNNVFDEDYEAYEENTLPSDYIMVYSGAGSNQQGVESDGINKYLHTAGQSGWSLAMRKDFDLDFPDQIEVSWRMQTQTTYTSSNLGSGGVASVGSFSVKNESETTAAIGLGNKADGEIYIYVWDRENEIMYTTMVNRHEWVECTMVIDFLEMNYDAYVNGVLLAENISTSQANLSSTWNSYGEDAAIHFSSGNHSSTTTLFDDISIWGISKE